MAKRGLGSTSSIIFKLADTMNKKGFSKNRLCRETGVRFETVQGYYNGTIGRVDLYILSEFCKVLKCNIEDIIEYCPNKKQEREKVSV